MSWQQHWLVNTGDVTTAAGENQSWAGGFLRKRPSVIGCIADAVFLKQEVESKGCLLVLKPNSGVSALCLGVIPGS